MVEGRNTRNRERSVSGDFEDTDFESHAGDANPPGKPGRKKNPNSQAARRDQNRIAQREFRLRKQQRIRDLEARVEILSGGQDEALGEMRNMLKDLMAENQTLRNLLRGLGSFIGDGAGGLLPKLGWEMADFTEFINRSETDTAIEGFQSRKKAHNGENSTSKLSSTPLPQSNKRSSEGDSIGTRTKKARNDDKDLDSARNGFSMLMPMSGTTLPSASTLYSGRVQETNGIFSDLMRGPASPLFMASSSGNVTSQYPAASLDGFSRSYLPGGNMNMEHSMTPSTYDSPASASSNAAKQRGQSSADSPAQEEVDDDEPKKNEAYKLIHYHLENYKRNQQYCLPASLRPTVVQKTLPHESVVDGVIHPDLRDRMILLRNRFELVDCLMDFKRCTTIHGDDVLAHGNWEIGESFIRKYSFLIDPPLLKLCNRWRRERGDQEIVLAEVNGEHVSPS